MRPQVYALLRSALNESHWDSAPRVLRTLSLLRSFCLRLAGIMPASKEKNSHLWASPQWLFLFSSHYSASTPHTRVLCTLSLLRSFCLWLAGILPALK